MKALHFYIIFSFILLNSVDAQSFLRGKVLSETTGQPLSGASIYFNNTSIGTLSNSNGEFNIPDAVAGELIISSVGYERLIYPVKKEQLGVKTFTFKLQEKENIMQDILILPDATRKKYLKLFRDNFLGITEEADRSRITNMGAIYFIRSPNDKNGIIALSDTPLNIINNQLGYKVEFDLVQFYLNENTGRTSFYGFTRYNEMGDRRRFRKNRRNAYYGSTVHFFRSLVSNRLQEESYNIYIIKEDSLKQKSNSISAGNNKMDIAFPAKATDIITRDSVSGLFSANWGPKLMVQYLKKPGNRNYLTGKGLLVGVFGNGFRAYLHAENYPVKIDANGLLEDPMNVFYSGYWIYEKAASLLPYNYYPDND